MTKRVRSRSMSDLSDDTPDKILCTDIQRWYGKSSLTPEPILSKPDNEFILELNGSYKDVLDMVYLQQSSMWVVSEIDCTKDIQDWKVCSDRLKHLIQTILGFFVVADGMVNDNISDNFSSEIRQQEILYFYTQQAAIEGVHQEMYSKIAIALCDTGNNEIFELAKKSSVIARKGEWTLKWMNTQTPISMRLIAFAIVEGLFFSASFAAIHYIKTLNVFPGLTASNEFISRDEGIHRDFAVMLVNNHIVNKPLESTIREMMLEAVEIESGFVENAFSAPLCEGDETVVTGSDMIKYVKFIADGLMVDLRYNKIFNTECPPFLVGLMSRFSAVRKGNFFEHRSTDYKRSNFNASDIVNVDDF